MSAADRFSFVFLKVALQHRFVVSPLHTDSGLFSVHVSSLPQLFLGTAQGAEVAELGEVVVWHMVSCRCSWVSWGNL